MSSSQPADRLPEDWLNGLSEGDQEVATEIFQRHLDVLKRLVQKRLPPGVRRLTDEDDIANSVFKSFFKGVKTERFPRLETDDDLWQILGMLVKNKVAGQIRYLSRKKRGGGQVRGESVFTSDGTDSQVGGIQTQEEFHSMLAQLQDDQLSEIAVMKLNALTNREIAAKLDISERSVERKLQRIRNRWEPETNGEQGG
jgi:DNA-directed RNA polymerase specialized sigma24 family protein